MIWLIRMCSTLLLAVYGRTMGTIKFYSDCWVKLKRERFVWLWSLVDLQWGHTHEDYDLRSLLSLHEVTRQYLTTPSTLLVSLHSVTDVQATKEFSIMERLSVQNASNPAPTLHATLPGHVCRVAWTMLTLLEKISGWQVLEKLLLCHICTIVGICKKSEHSCHCSQSYFQCIMALVHFSSISSAQSLLVHCGASYSVEESCDHIRFAILQCRPIAIIITRACHETLAISTEGIWFVSLSLGKIATVFLWFSRSWYLDGTKLHSS